MEILDSGERREFSTGSVRDMSEGKGRFDLTPLDALSALHDIVCAIDLDTEDPLVRLAFFQASGDGQELLFAAAAYIVNDKLDFWTVALNVAKHFENGAKKYGEHNWEKGIPVSSYLDSATRHYVKMRAKWTDEPHDVAFVWNCLCGYWTCEHKPELNNLPWGK